MKRYFTGYLISRLKMRIQFFFLLIRNSISKKVRVYKKQVTAEIYVKENMIQKRHLDGDFL